MEVGVLRATRSLVCSWNHSCSAGFFGELIDSEQDVERCDVSVQVTREILVVLPLCHGGSAAAWERGQDLAVHGWIYGLKDGLLGDLNVTITNVDEAAPVCLAAVAHLAKT